MPAFTHVLVPTDFSEAADHALDLAIGFAELYGAALTLLHASWLPPEAYAAHAGREGEQGGSDWSSDEVARAARRALEAATAKVESRYPTSDAMVAFGEPWQRILECAADRGADLIVMGTHGSRRSVLAHAVLGSVAEKVVRYSPVPVLTVPTPRR
jgi:nucleotide-binding universal stress UspA family protein